MSPAEYARETLKPDKGAPKLPHVHAEASEYYGGAHVNTRARTFSSVSGTVG